MAHALRRRFSRHRVYVRASCGCFRRLVNVYVRMSFVSDVFFFFFTFSRAAVRIFRHVAYVIVRENRAAATVIGVAAQARIWYVLVVCSRANGISPMTSVPSNGPRDTVSHDYFRLSFHANFLRTYILCQLIVLCVLIIFYITRRRDRTVIIIIFFYTYSVMYYMSNASTSVCNYR